MIQLFKGKKEQSSKFPGENNRENKEEITTNKEETIKSEFKYIDEIKVCTTVPPLTMQDTNYFVKIAPPNSSAVSILKEFEIQEIISAQLPQCNNYEAIILLIDYKNNVPKVPTLPAPLKKKNSVKLSSPFKSSMCDNDDESFVTSLKSSSSSIYEEEPNTLFGYTASCFMPLLAHNLKIKCSLKKENFFFLNFSQIAQDLALNKQTIKAIPEECLKNAGQYTTTLVVSTGDKDSLLKVLDYLKAYDVLDVIVKHNICQNVAKNFQTKLLETPTKKDLKFYFK